MSADIEARLAALTRLAVAERDAARRFPEAFASVLRDWIARHPTPDQIEATLRSVNQLLGLVAEERAAAGGAMRPGGGRTR